ncbi:phage tail protein [Antarcticibacterium arcticum]|uniref:Phage tail protein n=1 Tax=Antarcticibacterium arcticum TaxID=2585771 RepID=A0A5B8YHV1_9FLAO|nr:phage tail protein [Antarcticibacterium arcticum]QED37365.1 phage tail protein [Antarcticibacterium arcticum]
MEGEAQDNLWPLPKFYFSVKFCLTDSTALFQEISGLETGPQVMEYRHGDSNQFSTINKSGKVTLKKGIFGNDDKFLKWYDAIKMNTIHRETVTIQLLDENGNASMTWTLLNAWLTKISSPDMKSNANEVVIETLELAHEGLTIGNV